MCPMHIVFQKLSQARSGRVWRYTWGIGKAFRKIVEVARSKSRQCIVFCQWQGVLRWHSLSETVCGKWVGDLLIHYSLFCATQAKTALLHNIVLQCKKTFKSLIDLWERNCSTMKILMYFRHQWSAIKHFGITLSPNILVKHPPQSFKEGSRPTNKQIQCTRNLFLSRKKAGWNIMV